MEDDEYIYFAEELQQITPRIIPTSFGDVYAHTAGTPGQPLIMVVHGSGPKNSADQYAFLLHEYLVRVSYIEKFYLVAIDCPGYGRSKGSKQAIKTFPLRLFQDLLRSLNYRTYFAMLGHSQGGAAIFNAVFEEPSITQYLVMDRPVCGNIQRFRGFSLPTLLIYDIEDDGHPIWQGKLLYKQLKNSEFYTYRTSIHEYWVPDHIWELMLSFFAKQAKQAQKKGRGEIKYQRRNKSLTREKSKKHDKQQEYSVDRLQDIKKKEVAQQRLVQIEEVQKSELLSISSKGKWKEQEKMEKEELQWFSENGEAVDANVLEFKEPEIEIDDEGVFNFNYGPKIEIPQIMPKKENPQTKPKKQINVKSKIPKIIIDLERQQMKKVSYQTTKKEKKQVEVKELQKQPIKATKIPQPIKLVEPTEEKIEQKVKEEVQKKPKQEFEEKSQEKSEEKPKLAKQDLLKDENKCAICYQTLYRPINTNCNHHFCHKCIMESLLVNEKCPLCRAKITKKTEDQVLHDKLIKDMTSSDVLRREKDFRRVQVMLKSIVYLQVGNNSRQLQTKQSIFTKTKKKYVWELFVRQPKNFPIEEVGFNINMGDSNSKPVRIRNPPFVFQSRGTFSFACEITVKPKNKEYADIVDIYRINVEPGTHTKVIALKKKCYVK